MNYERMGIYVSIIVLIGVLGVAGISSGEFDLGVGEVKIPNITASTNTDTSKYSYYEWCHAIGKSDC